MYFTVFNQFNDVPVGGLILIVSKCGFYYVWFKLLSNSPYKADRQDINMRERKREKKISPLYPHSS